MMAVTLYSAQLIFSFAYPDVHMNDMACLDSTQNKVCHCISVDVIISQWFRRQDKYKFKILHLWLRVNKLASNQTVQGIQVSAIMLSHVYIHTHTTSFLHTSRQKSQESWSNQANILFQGQNAKTTCHTSSQPRGWNQHSLSKPFGCTPSSCLNQVTPWYIFL